MTTGQPVFHLPPHKIADSEQLAPLQYTIADTARLLSVSKNVVSRLIASGELESVGTGRQDLAAQAEAEPETDTDHDHG